MLSEQHIVECGRKNSSSFRGQLTRLEHLGVYFYQSKNVSTPGSSVAGESNVEAYRDLIMKKDLRGSEQVFHGGRQHHKQAVQNTSVQNTKDQCGKHCMEIPNLAFYPNQLRHSSPDQCKFCALQAYLLYFSAERGVSIVAFIQQHVCIFKPSCLCIKLSSWGAPSPMAPLIQAKC